MTTKEVNLYSELLGERYGAVIKSVGTYLMKKFAPQPCPAIAKATGLQLKDVKPAIAMLLHQDIAQLTINPRGIPLFTVKPEKVFPMLIHPQCICYTKDRLGNTAELILDEIFLNSTLSMSAAIKHVVERLHEATGEDYTIAKVKEVQEAFVQLAQNKLIVRCPNVTLPTEEKVAVHEHQLYAVPEIQLDLLEKVGGGSDEVELEPAAKKRKIKKAQFPDKEIHWRVNIERFEVHLRNNFIVNAAEDVMDKKASDIVKAIFERSELAQFSDNKLWTPTTPPVSYYEILNHLENFDGKELQLYLTALSDCEYHFVSKCDDRSGGMYVINTSKVIIKLTETATADVITEKFGSKYSRIFRLLLEQKYLESKHIGEYCMIPSKDVENYIYELMGQSFVTIKAIAKTPDYVPKKTIYLFHVDMKAVTQMLLQDCYHTLYNIVTFLDSFRKSHTRLVEKKMRLDVIISTLEQTGAEQEQIDEVAQMITPVEKEALEAVNKSCNKLNSSMCQLSNMVLLLKSYTILTSSKGKC